MDLRIEEWITSDKMFFENSQTLLCKLEDGLVYNYGLIMLMFHGDPLLRRVSETIDRVVEAGLYNHWISLNLYELRVHARKTALVNQHEGYYSFKVYHMQPSIYLLLMGWCISFLCFMVELLYNRFLSKRKKRF
jgi:hypothetical protein